MLSSLTAATLAGLVGSPHCIGMCGGFAMACGTGPDRGGAWHLGRLATYAGLGALAGSFGSVIPGPGWVAAAFATVLMVWFSLVLAGVVKEPSFQIPGITRIATRAASESGTGWRFLFGMSTGPALAAVTLGVRTFALRNLAVRRLLAVGVLLAGLGSIGMRQGLVGGMSHGDHTPPDSGMESHVHDG
jgi:hypothetical protein